MEKNGNLYIELGGDFDGSSAMQLLNQLETRRTEEGKIFINTNDLRDIHPFGKAVFEKHMSPHYSRSTDIVFTGSSRGAFM
jgi:hypothetical protein